MRGSAERGILGRSGRGGTTRVRTAGGGVKWGRGGGGIGVG